MRLGLYPGISLLQLRRIFGSIPNIYKRFTQLPIYFDTNDICFNNSLSRRNVRIRLPSQVQVILQIWAKVAPEAHSNATSTRDSLMLYRYSSYIYKFNYLFDLYFALVQYFVYILGFVHHLVQFLFQLRVLCELSVSLGFLFMHEGCQQRRYLD